MTDLEDRWLTRHAFHGEWNYALAPVPRPAPEPEPAPEPAAAAPPGLCDPAALNHPALTGLDPAGLDALAAALEIPFAARREQRRYLRHGRARQRAPGAGGANRKLDLTGHLLATRMRQHLNLPPKVIGALLAPTAPPSATPHLTAPCSPSGTARRSRWRAADIPWRGGTRT